MSRPKILHIINSFAINALYSKLAKQLDQLKINQIIYAAVRTKKESEYHPVELSDIPIFCHNILKWHDIIFFRKKIQKIYKDIVAHIDPVKVNLIHAHTLYSDGATALKLKKSFNIPYIVAVRSGDIKAFGKLRPDLVFIRNQVLMNAEKIIFLSPFYKNILLTQLNGSIQQRVNNISEIIPNGIDTEFLKSWDIPKEKPSNSIKILYVGSFLKRKNVTTLINAVSIISLRRKVQLTLIGEGGDQESTVKKMLQSGKFPFLKYLGKIENKEKLRELYQSHDIFVMASWQETFGLVYIEALSQGIPVVYTRGEGIDGYFEERSIGEAINNPLDSNEIALRIEMLYKRLSPTLSEECIRKSKQFNWVLIAKQYNEIYKSILGVRPDTTSADVPDQSRPFAGI